MKLPQNFLDEVKARVPVSDVIGKRIKIQKAGHEYKACCPFHNEKTPSFTINDDKGFYHCFGCGAHGSVIDFLIEYDKMPFMEAVKSLASLAGLSVPEPTPEDAAQQSRNEQLYIILDKAAAWFHHQLLSPEHKAALDYLHSRGIDLTTIEEFRIGFAPEDRQALRSHLLADSLGVEAGLLKTSDKSRDPYDFFRGRIMFPVQDRKGRVVAFGGRILPDHLRAPDRGNYTPAKYMNSPETPVFQKGYMLYNENRALPAARSGHGVIVTEGYADVIACHRAGFKGAVAPLGTALTAEQIGQLWRLCPEEPKEPVLCFDGDAAGFRAAQRAAERILPLLRPNHSALFAFLPAGEDPDSLLRKEGKDALKNILKAAIPLHEFIWRNHTQGQRFDKPEARAALSKNLNQISETIEDMGVRAHYKSLFKDRVWSYFKDSSKGRTRTPYKAPASASYTMKANQQTLQIKIILAGLIKHPDLIETFENRLGQLDPQNPDLAACLTAILDYNAELSSPPDTQSLQTYLDQAGLKEVSDSFFSAQCLLHAPFLRPNYDFIDTKTGIEDIFALMDKRNVEHEIKAAKQALAANYTDTNAEKIKALKDLQRG